MPATQIIPVFAVFFILAAILVFIYLQKKKLEREKKLQDLLDSTDELTQVNNKKHIDEMLARELDRAKRNGSSISFVILEIDRFQELKLEYGQQFCQRVLQDTADNLREKIRAYDVLSRDKHRFLCLFPETDAEAALLLSKRARAVVAAEDYYFRVDGKAIHVTACVGATSYKPGLEDIGINDIKRTAEKALELAKKQGQNTLEYVVTSIDYQLE